MMRFLRLSFSRAFIGLIVIMLYSCDPGRVYESYVEIPEYKWHRENQPEFNVNIKDTSQACRILLNIRNSISYPYKNIYLFLYTQYPDGSLSKDTLEFLFNNEKGQYLGDCKGDICNNRFVLKENIKFEDAGPYVFRLEHAMRSPDGVLPFIMNIGFRIERMK